MLTLQNLLADPRNPRTITAEAADGLRASVSTFGDIAGLTWNQRTGQMVAGHQRLNALKAEAARRGVSLHMDGEAIVLPAGAKPEEAEQRFSVRVVDWTDQQQAAANLTANNPAIGGMFTEGLGAMLAEVEEALPDLFADTRLAELKAEAERLAKEVAGGTGGEGDEPPEPQTDRAAELAEKWGTAQGQVWEIPSKTVPGRCHRVACADSTVAADVTRLMGETVGVNLLHADPPYGMGKEADGIANDNLYGDKLDAFQMAWWRTWRPFLADNASAYIWGNAPELWRLWYVGGLEGSERLTLRNEIVWDKGIGQGVAAEGFRSYAPGSERCLVFMLGEQGFNDNADNYWEGWEPIRSYLEGERVKSGLSNADCNQACGKANVTQPAFTRGGFRLILREDYEKLREASGRRSFLREYDDLKREYDDLKRDHDELKRAFYATRAYFDNTHDNMTDVWEFPRVTGEDRHGHATPKPVALVARAIKSSCPAGGIVAEPFLGSGTTAVAAEREGRICVGAELSPAYVAVILQRLADMGLEPRRVS